jgi:hypothetical protein
MIDQVCAKGVLRCAISYVTHLLGHRILPEEADRVSSSYRASHASGAIPLRSSSSSMIKATS